MNGSQKQAHSAEHRFGEDPQSAKQAKTETVSSSASSAAALPSGRLSVVEAVLLWKEGKKDLAQLEALVTGKHVAVDNPSDSTPVSMMQPSSTTTTCRKMLVLPADSKMPPLQCADLIHMGILRIARRGRQGESRHLAIFPDSLRYWTSASDMTSGKDARGRFDLRDITRFHPRGADFEICVFRDQWLTLIPDEGDMREWASAFAQVFPVPSTPLVLPEVSQGGGSVHNTSDSNDVAPVSTTSDVSPQASSSGGSLQNSTNSCNRAPVYSTTEVPLEVSRSRGSLLNDTNPSNVKRAHKVALASSASLVSRQASPSGGNPQPSSTKGELRRQLEEVVCAIRAEAESESVANQTAQWEDVQLDTNLQATMLAARESARVQVHAGYELLAARQRLPSVPCQRFDMAGQSFDIDGVYSADWSQAIAAQ